MNWMEDEHTNSPWWQDWLTPKNALAAAGLVILLTVPFIHRGGKLVDCGPYDPPRQSALSSYKPLDSPPEYEIFGTDTYEVDALIMSRKRYRFDEESNLAPIDFLLAWGPLTQEPVLSEIKWSQSSRWGHYRYQQLSIPSKQIARNSANTHIIPAFDDHELHKELMGLRKGDAVTLTGYLVTITGPDNWSWKSSRTRDDSGDGACEILYVTGVSLLN